VPCKKGRTNGKVGYRLERKNGKVGYHVDRKEQMEK